MRAWSADWVPVAVLVAGAAGLAVYAGTDWKQAAGPAAAALGGAALTRAVDVVREQRRDADRERIQKLDGLGETRRLMMGLIPTMQHASQPLLAATVVHSLLYQHPELLENEDRAAITRWEKAGYGATESAVGALDAFNRLIPRVTAEETGLKQQQ